MVGEECIEYRCEVRDVDVFLYKEGIRKALERKVFSAPRRRRIKMCVAGL